MSLLSIVGRMFGRSAGSARRQPFRRSRLQLETLEERVALSNIPPPNILIYPHSQPNFSEIAMGVNPRNPNDIVVFGTVIAGNSPNMGIFTSLNGGRSWHTIVVNSAFDGGISTALRGDPTVTFDSAGRCHVGYLVVSNSVTTIETAISHDGGIHWSTVPARIDPFTTVGLNDKETITAATAPGANPNLIVMGYIRFANDVAQSSTPEVIASSDGGQTWSAPTAVGPTRSGADFVQFCQPIIGPNNTIYVSWVNLTQDLTTGLITSESIEFRSGTFKNGKFNFGATVLAAHVLSPTFKGSIPSQPHRGIGSIPVIAVDNSHGKYRGSVYIAYPDGPKGTDPAQLDIKVVFSRGIGKGFSQPVTVNHDTIGASHFNPWIAVDQTTGQVGVEWRDSRLDPNDEKVNVFSAFSNNGGAKFGQNLRISSAASDEAASGSELNDFLEYDGFAMTSGTAYYAWSDNRFDLNGDKELFFAKLKTGATASTTATAAARSSVVLSDDRFEPNDTSSAATALGTLGLGTRTLTGLTIDRHPNGLFDNDWFSATTGRTGTLTVTINYTPANGGDLNLRLYTVDSSGHLQLLGASTRTGVKSQRVSVHVTAGEPIFAWVYGFNHAEATYNLSATLS
jgi:hypothetical protein